MTGISIDHQKDATTYCVCELRKSAEFDQILLDFPRACSLVTLFKCRVPDDCIDFKRYPLFMAREVMRGLIEQLKAQGAIKP